MSIMSIVFRNGLVVRHVMIHAATCEGPLNIVLRHGSIGSLELSSSHQPSFHDKSTAEHSVLRARRQEPFVLALLRWSVQCTGLSALRRYASHPRV